MKDICLLTITSVKKRLNPEDRKYCFEIFQLTLKLQKMYLDLNKFKDK